MKKMQRISLPAHRSVSAPEYKEPYQLVFNCWNENFQEGYPIYPAGFEDAIRKNKTWYQVIKSRYFLIVAVESGEMIYRNADDNFLLRGNRVLIIPQGTTYSFETTAVPYYRKLSLLVLGVNLSNITETLELNQMKIINVPNLQELISSMREINDLIISHQIEKMPEMTGKTLTLLSRLSNTAGKKNEKSLVFQIAKSRLNSNFSNKIKISDLAFELKVSTITLERLFKKELNMTPSEYHLLSKMNYAKDLLLNSNLSIKEIAFQLGYCHQFHFSNEFKRITGKTPFNFRQNK